MAVVPPPRRSSSDSTPDAVVPPLRRSSSDSTPDVILSIVFPFSLLCVVFFMASFFLGANNIKQFGAFGLCGLASFLLFQSSTKDGGTIVNWSFNFTEWAMLALIAHSLYFGVIHDLVTK